MWNPLLLVALASVISAAPTNCPAQSEPAQKAPEPHSAAISSREVASAVNLGLNQIPAFGVTPGIPFPGQEGSCTGANDKAIPCQCPPSVEAFEARLAQYVQAGNIFGNKITFSTDDADQSPQTNLARIDAMISTLQNFDNTKPGEGCPAVSAPNFSTVQAELLKLV